MDNFSEHIRSKLENYEVPYDENSWYKIQRKLRFNKIKRITKYIGTISSVILISTLVYFSTKPENINLANTSIQTKQILIENTTVIVPEKINNKRTYDIQYNLPILTSIDQQIISETTIDTIDKIVETPLQFTENIEEEIIIDSIDTKNLIDSPLVDTTLLVIPQPIYYFPTAFSPNGDGLNDEFFPIGIDLTTIKFQFLIYDRWGNDVFESMNPEYRWNGENCKSGLYVWIFRYQDNDGNIHLDKGQVTLIK